MPERSKPEYRSLSTLLENDQFSRYLNRHARDADEAAEVYQESIVRVLEQARRTQIDNPLAYAIRIAKNLFGRRELPEEDVSDQLVCDRFDPEALLHHRQRLEWIAEATAAMPELRRRVFTLQRLHGHSRQEIAAELGISTDAVSKHLARAMADLQRHIDRKNASSTHDAAMLSRHQVI